MVFFLEIRCIEGGCDGNCINLIISIVVILLFNCLVKERVLWSDLVKGVRWYWWRIWFGLLIKINVESFIDCGIMVDNDYGRGVVVCVDKNVLFIVYSYIVCVVVWCWL